MFEWHFIYFEPIAHFREHIIWANGFPDKLINFIKNIPFKKKWKVWTYKY